MSNYTEFQDQSSQNPSILTMILDKNVPSSKKTSSLPRLGYTLRRVQGFTSLLILKFTYPLHKVFFGDACIWVCSPDKSESVLQSKVGLSECVHHTQTLTFFTTFWQRDPLFYKKYLSTWWIRFGPKFVFFWRKMRHIWDRVWVGVFHENFSILGWVCLLTVVSMRYML